MDMNKISKSHENEQNLKSHENEQNLKKSKMNKSRESHEYEQNLKKSWKLIKTGKVMNMNKI